VADARCYLVGWDQKRLYMAKNMFHFLCLYIFCAALTDHMYREFKN